MWMEAAIGLETKVKTYATFFLVMKKYNVKMPLKITWKTMWMRTSEIGLTSPERLVIFSLVRRKAYNSLSSSAKTLCEKAYQDNLDNAVNEKFNQWANMERNACEIFYGGASKECERSNYLWARDCFKNCTKSLANSETGYRQCMLQCEDSYANSKNDATTPQFDCVSMICTM